MIFSFLRNRISKKEIAVLLEAENSLNIPLIEGYRNIPKQNRKRFLASCEHYNKCHREYLDAERKFNETCRRTEHCDD